MIYKVLDIVAGSQEKKTVDGNIRLIEKSPAGSASRIFTSRQLHVPAMSRSFTCAFRYMLHEDR